MGAVTFSIDPKLVEALSHCLHYDLFVETGTFCGETIDIVKGYFKHIYSIELSEHYYAKALEKFGHDKTITLLNADAATGLSQLAPTLAGRSVMYWLDAHWCVADATAGERSQCPLLAELGAIHPLNENSMVIIDDARLFLSTPQKPHEVSNWPSLNDILVALRKLSAHHRVAVLNDCILFFPEAIEPVIKQFSHEAGIDWLDVLNRCKSTEALLEKLSQENQMLHNLGVWRRVRGIFGYIWRTYGRQNRLQSIE